MARRRPTRSRNRVVRLKTTCSRQGTLSPSVCHRSIDVTFHDQKDNSEKTVQVPLGQSLLEAAHNNDIDLEGAQHLPIPIAVSVLLNTQSLSYAVDMLLCRCLRRLFSLLNMSCHSRGMMVCQLSTTSPAAASASPALVILVLMEQHQLVLCIRIRINMIACLSLMMMRMTCWTWHLH